MSAHSANRAVLIAISFDRFALRLDRHEEFVGNAFMVWQKETFLGDYRALRGLAPKFAPERV
jgi:hypothetical protein